MNLQEIKYIYETNSPDIANRLLKKGWYLLTVYQPDSKNINYVLGTKEKINLSTKVEIGLGLTVEID